MTYFFPEPVGGGLREEGSERGSSLDFAVRYIKKVAISSVLIELATLNTPSIKVDSGSIKGNNCDLLLQDLVKSLSWFILFLGPPENSSRGRCAVDAHYFYMIEGTQIRKLWKLIPRSFGLTGVFSQPRAQQNK